MIEQHFTMKTIFLLLIIGIATTANTSLLPSSLTSSVLGVLVFADAASSSSTSSSSLSSSGRSTTTTQRILQRYGIDMKSSVGGSATIMKYSIFNDKEQEGGGGGASLRNLPTALKQELFSNHDSKDVDPSLKSQKLSKAAVAIILLLAGYTDASHEVILGVTPYNIDEAEYAATHRGETNWTSEHPLTEVDDIVHSLIHRREGPAKGEGGYTGFENGKYWIAGGPKLRPSGVTTTHPCYQSLAAFAKKHTPMCVDAGVVVGETTKTENSHHATHQIIQGGGKEERTVTVPRGCWDPFCFIDLCRDYSRKQDQNDAKQLQEEIRMLEEKEIDLLLEHELSMSHPSS